MTIHLPEDLERYVQDQVLEGRFRTEDEVIRDALERHRQAQLQSIPATAIPDPVLGCMRDDADLMDEIVADAYRHRREEVWREIDL
jgi:Arc/MetJ-type ribon-helix-helix transcriptional regulator